MCAIKCSLLFPSFPLTSNIKHPFMSWMIFPVISWDPPWHITNYNSPFDFQMRSSGFRSCWLTRFGFRGTKIGTILEEVKGSICSILTFVKGPSSSDCFCPYRGLFPWTNTEAAGWIEGKKLSLCGPWKIC